MATAIKKVAVLGAGVMGQGIAAHLANAGVPSVLYDIVPGNLPDGAPRSSLAINGLKNAVKLKPAAFFTKSLSSLVTPANYEDDGALLSECDLIIEVVVERLDIKAKVYEWVAKHRRADAIVASNTSGLQLADMAAWSESDAVAGPTVAAAADVALRRAEAAQPSDAAEKRADGDAVKASKLGSVRRVLTRMPPAAKVEAMLAERERERGGRKADGARAGQKRSLRVSSERAKVVRAATSRKIRSSFARSKARQGSLGGSRDLPGAAPDHHNSV